jgi:hypothetical protein
MEGRSADDPAKSTSIAAKTAQSPDRILDIGCAFCKSKVLLSAVELGLFTELGGDPLDLGWLTVLMLGAPLQLIPVIDPASSR